MCRFNKNNFNKRLADGYVIQNILDILIISQAKITVAALEMAEFISL